MSMVIGEDPKVLTLMGKFLMIDLPSAYNGIIERLSLNTTGAVI